MRVEVSERAYAMRARRSPMRAMCVGDLTVLSITGQVSTGASHVQSEWASTRYQVGNGCPTLVLQCALVGSLLNQKCFDFTQSVVARTTRDLLKDGFILLAEPGCIW